MGKRPIIGFLGLVMAGIALTGCGECCRNNNTRNGKFGSKGAFDKGTPLPPSPPVPPMIGDTRNPSATGTKGTDLKPDDKGIQQVSGTGLPSGVTPADARGIGAPGGVDTLKPAIAAGKSDGFDRSPSGDGFPIAGMPSTENRSTIPPMPVRNSFTGPARSSLPERPLSPDSGGGAGLSPLPTGGAPVAGAPQGLPSSPPPAMPPTGGTAWPTDAPPPPAPPMPMGKPLPPLPGGN